MSFHRRIRASLVMSLAIIWILSPLAAASNAAATETTAIGAGVDADFKARLDELCRRIEEGRIDANIPGLALAVVHNDKVVLARGFGLADIEKNERVSAETIFAVGSTTKAFTAAVACMLDAEGKMSLDAPVRTYVPAFKLKDAEANEKVTVRDLLSHRTGITRMGILWAGGTLTTDEIVPLIAEAEPYRPFRSAFLYNNVMYMVAGKASANAANTTWHDLIQKRIFKPLGMNMSNTSVSATEKNPLSAKGYSWDDRAGEWDREDMRDIESAAPAGAINSNVLDMAQWIRFQLARGKVNGKQILDERYFEDIWSPHIQITPQMAYGLGWMLQEWQGKKVVEHGGNIDGFAAQVGLLPEENLGYCLLANITATPLQQGSLSLVWETLLGDSGAADAVAKAEVEAAGGTAAFSEKELARYEGKFFLEPMQANLTAQIKDGKLAVDVPGQQLYTLKWPDDEGKWYFELTDQIAVSFELPEDDGNAVAMSIYQGGATFRMPRASKAGLPSVADVIALRKKAGILKKSDESAATRSTGTIRFVHQGAGGAFSAHSKGNDRFLQVLDLGKIGKVQMAAIGDRAFRQQPGDEPEELDGKEAAEIRHENPLALFGDWLDYWQKVEVTGKRNFHGIDVIVVTLTDDIGESFEVFVHPETGVLAGYKRTTHSNGISMPLETRFLDNKQIDGVSMPMRTVTALPQSGDLVVQIDKIETGVEPLDDSAFILVSAEKAAGMK